MSRSASARVCAIYPPALASGRVSKPSFVVKLADLERGPKSVEWEIPEAWLRAALGGTEALPRGAGALSVELTKDGAKVMVRGHASAHLTMPCARTLDPVDVEVAPEIFLLLSPSTAEVRRPPAVSAAARNKLGAPKASKPGKGAAESRRGGRGGWSEDPELTAGDAAGDTYSGDSVVLDEFLREFILLELPMFPVRQDLPSAAGPAIAPPHSDTGGERPIDPRLMPLAALASRLRQNKE